MKKYICLFLVGFFLGFWEDQKATFEEIQKEEIKAPPNENKDTSLFLHPLEELPRFKHGSHQELLKKIMAELRPSYPKEGCFGSIVVISFMVNKKGLVEKPIIKRSICPPIDQQLLQIIEKLEFIPGKIDGEIVAMELHFPIRICLR